MHDPATPEETAGAVIVADQVAGFEDGRVGEYAYRYPRVDAEVIYLWPVQRRLPVQVGIGVGYVHW